MKIVAYTALCGDRDVLRHTGRLGDPRFVCFMDPPPAPWLNGSYLGWTVRPAETSQGSPRMNAKRHRIMPHWDFPDVEASLYMNATHVLQESIDLERLAWVYLRSADLATFRHGLRDCMYAEAEACIAAGLDDPARIRGQMERYRREGFPAHSGLPALTVLLRRHTDRVRRFNELWWQEVQHGSVRDQLSFPYAAWRTGLRWTEIGGDAFFNDLFHFVPHGWLWSEGGLTL